MSITDKRPLKVFPSTGSPVPAAPAQAGHRHCHAHIIPLWDADRDAVRALYTRLTDDGVDRIALDGQGIIYVTVKAGNL